MEKLNPHPDEERTLSIEPPDAQLKKLLDPEITKDDWKTYWQDPDFTELFPNMTFRLLSLEGSNKYTQEQREGIFKLAFTSFMEISWKHGGVARSATINKVNEETQLWKNAGTRQVEPDSESFIGVAIGCFILQALSLKNKEGAISLIVGAYKNLATSNKRGTFVDHILNKLITTRNAFRQWVKKNNLDTNNGFSWDTEVTRLGLRLLPQGKFPSDFNDKDLTGYSLSVIAEVVCHILRMSTTKNLRSAINVFTVRLEQRLESKDLNDEPELYNGLQKKLNDLRSLIKQ